LVVWLIVTVLIAGFGAHLETDHSDADPTTAAPPPLTRATTTLASHTIQSVLSADGSVVAHGRGFVITAPVTPDGLAYKLLDKPYSVKALIVGGPAGFDCPWAGIAASTDGPGVSMSCDIPAGIKAAAGLSATMVVALGKPTTVQALPVTAVVGSARQGQVVIVSRGPHPSTHVATVALGISDTSWIQVTGGLSTSDTVLTAPTQSDLVDG